jgi:WD40 repeat protein
MDAAKYIAKFRDKGTTGTVFQPGEKACNRCVINRDGDLLFVASDKFIYGYNLMTETNFNVYRGHEGVVEDLDVDSTSRFLVSVASDKIILLHDVATSRPLQTCHTEFFMRCCCFAPGLMQFFAVVSATVLGQQPVLSIFRYGVETLIQKGASLSFTDGIGGMIWPSDDQIILGDEKGKLHEVTNLLDQTRQRGKTVDAHRGAINSLTLSFDRTFFASASADTTASTWDLNLQKIETFPHSFLVSCCAIAPNAPHIVLASSADKRTVASSNFGSTDFTINFFHLIFQEEFASVKVHKSTVNWVGFTPDGWTLVTTSHEGTFLVIRLGADYAALCEVHAKELEDIRKLRS